MNNKTLRLFFLITSLEGLVISGILYSKRFTDPGQFLQMGFTPISFLVFCLALLITILSIAITIYLSRNLNTSSNLGSLLRDEHIIPFIILLAAISIECIQNILFLFSPLVRPDPIIVHYKKILDVLLPLLIFGFLLSFQSILLILLTGSIRKRIISKQSRIPARWLIVYLTMMAVWIFIAVTDYGFIVRTSTRTVREIGRFNRLSRPLPGVQVFLILGLVFALGYFIQWIYNRKDSLQSIKKYPIVIPLLIGLIAIALWISGPIEPSYMVYESEISSGTFYPISDGFYFDKEAYRFLSGEGFEDRSTHVFYSFFLSGLHLIGGDRYQDIIGLQMAVAAIIPILLYMITKELHTPISGVIVALLYTFRERNGLFLSTEISGPVINQYLSENLALLGMVAFVYLFIFWIKNPEENRLLPFIIGGLFGISLLIRAEFAAAGLAIAGISFLISKPQNRKAVLIGLLSMALVTSIITVPWMARNKHRTGYFSLDKGNFIAKRVSELSINLTEEEDSVPIPSEGQYPEDDNIPLTSVISNHIGNSFTQLFLYLPNNHQPFTGYRKLIDNLFLKGEIGIQRLGLPMFSEQDIRHYVKTLPYYWKVWKGEISLTTYLPVTLSLLFITVGIAQVWKDRSIIVMIFLGLSAAHIFIWSFARFSGSRYIKPIDWIPLIFYGIGLTEITLVILDRYIHNAREKLVKGVGINNSNKPFSVPESWKVPVLWLTVIIIVVIGLGPTLLENRISPRFTEERLQDRVGELTLLKNPTILNEQCMKRIDQRDNMELLYGQALYPRFLKQDEKDSDTRGGTLPESYGPRVDFYVIGDVITWASLPQEDPSVPLDHTDEIILFGEWRKDSEPASPGDKNVYFHVQCMYVFPEHDNQTTPYLVACTGPHCMED